MGKEKINAAFVAWHLAISSFFGKDFPSDKSIEELARCYGERITDAESLDFVSTWFDWEVIESYLENQCQS